MRHEARIIDCEMCSEAQGVGAVVAYADDAFTVVAAREQRPANQGHVLIITKAHYADLYDAPAGIAGRLFELVRQVAWAVQVAAGADGTTIRQNNRPPGQDAFHLHVHVFPRHIDDNFLESEPTWVDRDIRVKQAEEVAVLLALDPLEIEARMREFADRSM